MSKYQYLINKCYWKSKENVTNLSANSAFSFLGIGPQMKTRNWRKIKFELFLTEENLWKGIRVNLGIILMLYYQRRKEIMIFCGFSGFRKFRGIDLALVSLNKFGHGFDMPQHTQPKVVPKAVVSNVAFPRWISS